MSEKNLELLSNSELKKLIEKRRKTIERIIKFAYSVINDHGETLVKERSYHTNITGVINNFGDFDIQGNFGMSQMGGNRVIIRFEDKEVFNVYYQVDPPSEFSIIIFDASPNWLVKFNWVMRNKRAIIALMKKRKTKTEEQRIEGIKKSDEKQKLLKEAKKLGLK
jgi:hypothetical protein